MPYLKVGEPVGHICKEDPPTTIVVMLDHNLPCGFKVYFEKRLLLVTMGARIGHNTASNPSLI